MTIPPRILEALLDARDFEDAGRWLIRGMLELFGEALRRNDWADDAELLRGFVHLRPGEGYRGLVEWPEQPEPSSASAARASATAWKALRRSPSPLWVDVEVGRFTPVAGAPWEEAVQEPGAAFSDTRRRLLDRDITHFGALPLRLPDGGLLGMVTLELRAADATGIPNFTPWQEVAPTLTRLAQIGALVLDRRPPRAGQATTPPDGLLLSPPPQAEPFAREDSPLLLTGESGTGKTRLARWCHDRSPRAKRPFVAANLQAVSAPLREAHLFGSVRGAFTGAVDREGCVTLAEGGTLFIDEVADLGPEAQLMLFRLLDDGVYHKLGDSRERRANVRILSATNLDLQAAVQQGRFREELLYRLNILALELRPLREVPDQLPYAATRLLEEMHYRRAKNHHIQVSTSALYRLRGHGWPGNLRELRSVLERAYILACHRAPIAPGRYPTEVLLEERDIDEALRQSSAAPAGLLATLRGSARAMLVEIERRQRESEPPLALDHADAFKGVLVAAALEVRPDPRKAAELLGIGHRERGRYLRSMRIAADKTRELCALLGEPVPGELAKIEGQD